MANGRIKIANNIEQVAQDIINYIFPYLKTPAEKRQHRNQLGAIFQKVWEDYQKPLIDLPGIAYIETHYINPYFRQRAQEIEATGKIIQESEDNERHIILHAITLMLEHGNCESTSANTLLLDLLIKQLGKYEPITEDKRLAGNPLKAYGSHVGIRETLRDTFVKKAKQIMENWEKEKKDKNFFIASPSKEIKEIQPLAVNPDFLEQLSLFATGKSLKRNVKQKIQNEIMAEVKSQKRQDILYPEQTTWVNAKHTVGCIEDYRAKVKEKRKVGKLNLNKLSEVVSKLNEMNKLKTAADNPELMDISLPPLPPIPRKVGRLFDNPALAKAREVVEEHTKNKLG